MLAGVSGRQLGQRAGISQTKVSRLERGDAVASTGELAAWLRVCDAQDRYDDLLAMVEAALNEVDDWRGYMRAETFAEMQAGVREREALARTVRVFQPTLVPGLLQTAEYARRVFAISDLAGGQDHSAAVQRRIERQQVLYQSDHQFEFILTEAALRWRPGPPEVLAAQLDRIANVATLSNVTLGVVPADAEVDVIPWHGFTMYDDVAGQDPFVQVETIHAYLTVAKPDDVALYRRQLDSLRAAALAGDHSLSLVLRLSEEHRHEPTRKAGGKRG